MDLIYGSLLPLFLAIPRHIGGEPGAITVSLPIRVFREKATRGSNRLRVKSWIGFRAGWRSDCYKIPTCYF